MSAPTPHRLVAIALLLSLVTGERAGAQHATLDLGITQILSAGTGIDQDSCRPTYSTGLGAAVAVPLLGRWASVAVSSRLYPFGRGPTCVTEPFQPRDGTFVVTDRADLQASRFLTTDARLQVVPLQGVALELGGGKAWREGRDLPYVVTAARLTVATLGTVRVNLGLEHSLLRVSTGRWRVTYADFMPISSEPLGRTQQWSHALLVGVSGSGRLF